MFKEDKAINTLSEDLLGRIKFSRHISNSILSWGGQESLVIGIYGHWGSGKSSVINLVKEEIRNVEHANKPTIIEYNPWEFTQQERIAEHFFNEIAKELKHNGSGKKDKEIALKFKKLSSVISFLPSPAYFLLKWIVVSSVLTISGLVSHYFSQVELITSVLIWVASLSWIALGILKILGTIFGNISQLFEIQSQINEKSNVRLKLEISELLRSRDNKLFIIMDDIDRLSAEEIRKLFALIRSNADFPNVFYLLAFDRKIVENCLTEGNEIRGREFLEKIVQVPFEIPHVGKTTLRKIFLKEMDAFLSNYPIIIDRFFGVNDSYWANVYYSGIENLFGSLRGVRRYLNSFRFNFTQLLEGEIIEVNPIDLMVLEAIRIFEPDYYEFMKTNEHIFTLLGQIKSYVNPKIDRKESFQRSLLIIKSENNRLCIEGLIRKLFPQIDGFYTHTTYSNYKSSWFADLHICSPQRYGRYFTLLPGAEDDELSEVQIQSILSNVSNYEKLMKSFGALIDIGKFRLALEQLNNYTSDERYFNINNFKALATALFDIMEEIEKIEDDLFDFGPDLEVYRILIQILKRSEEKEQNFLFLREAILSSIGITCSVYIVSLLFEKDENKKLDMPIDEDKVLLLQDLCVSKIIENKDLLLKSRRFTETLYRWKEWGDPEDVKNYIEEIINDFEKLIIFLNQFTAISRVFGSGDVVGIKTKGFQLKVLKNFADTIEIEKKVKSVMLENPKLYEANSEVLELFLKAQRNFILETRN